MKKTIIFLILLLPSQLIAASIDPSFEFLTIETEHFIIHYHQGLEEISKKAALTAEDIHTNLSRDLQWSPGGKTHIVLIDNTDFTNAFATVLPRNTIYIQVVPPMADMTIGEYEFAITHEYAHILTTDPARGYSKVMRKIFGKPLPGYTLLSLLTFMLTAPPNVLLPTWWLEGVATWAETEYTNSGRGRSTFTEMILRMAVEEDNIPTMDKLNGEVPYWPDGHIPYVWGLRLNMYIAEKYGKDSLGKLNITHAGKFPYVINSVPRRLFRKNYVSLYREMISALKKEQSEKIELLKKIPFTPYKIFNDRGETLTNPRYSPDGDLIAFNKRDPHEHETIVIVDSNSGRKVRTIRRLPSDHNITWSKEGDKICFTQAELHKGFNLYQDIYCYDLINNKQKRLTKGLRANAPDLSPDGSTFVFVKTERGTQNLAFLKADEKERSVKVITDYKEAQVSNPRWSSDGNLIVFSVKDNEGLSSLRTYNMNNKTFKVILKDRFNNIYPVWSPDDRFILFTSDRTGV
ncbi:MAG: TolB family protein, partial [Thermodesulfobacteriota bacterium]